MKNLPWLGPDISRMSAAFVAAFIPPKFKIVCAWCGEFMRGDALAPPENVSHGLCKSCKAEQEKLLDDRKREQK